jgi:putative SOS response-associated peptidase YedK
MIGYMEERFSAKFDEPERFTPIYHISAFKTPYLPIIADMAPDKIQFFQWGLIPFWVKDGKSARKLQFQTFNAKAETIHEKPSFRASIKNKRCLVLVDGFYEWHEQSQTGTKFPYFIRLKDQKLFALAGIWDTWENKDTGESKNTFSIITTEANPFLARIHNTKKRMPVILKQADEVRWLNPELDVEDINALLKPYDDSRMEAHTVSKLISQRGANTNVPSIMDEVEYSELKTEQQTLF